MEVFKKDAVAKNVFLYSIQDGTFKVYEGTLFWYHTSIKSITFFENVDKHIKCDQDPATVFNSALWLESRDDDLAAALLTEYENKIYNKYSRLVEAHKKRLDVLSTERLIEESQLIDNIV